MKKRPKPSIIDFSPKNNTPPKNSTILTFALLFSIGFQIKVFFTTILKTKDYTFQYPIQKSLKSQQIEMQFALHHLAMCPA